MTALIRFLTPLTTTLSALCLSSLSLAAPALALPELTGNGALPPIPQIDTGAAARPTGKAPSTYFRVVVPDTTADTYNQVRAIAPNAFRTTVNSQPMIQAGLYQEARWATAMQQQLNAVNLTAHVLATSDPPLVTGTPAAPTETLYRVIVPNTTADMLARVQAVEPNAFRMTLQGQSVVQAGLFRDRRWAETTQQRLVTAGLTAQLLTATAVASNPDPLPAPTTPQERVVVMIDPGHGGRDPGAVGVGGLREKDVNLAISQRVQQSLEAQGVIAQLTRAGDQGLELAPRVALADRAQADLFVSIHANAISLSRPEVNGLETYYYQTGADLAEHIHDSILQRTNMRDRGVRQARFYVLRNTEMPAVLVETGFVTGQEDAARFRNVAQRDQIADAIANGILAYIRWAKLG